MMKLKEGMITENMDGDYIAVATGKAAEGFNGIIHNNKTSDYLFNLLMEERTEEDLVEALMGKYDVDEGLAKADVKKLIAQLRNHGLIDE